MMFFNQIFNVDVKSLTEYAQIKKYTDSKFYITKNSLELQGYSNKKSTNFYNNNLLSTSQHEADFCIESKYYETDLKKYILINLGYFKKNIAEENERCDRNIFIVEKSFKNITLYKKIQE